MLSIKTFAFMLFLCLCGFANFYFIVNNNSEANPMYYKNLEDAENVEAIKIVGDAVGHSKAEEEPKRYVSEFVGQPVVDSLISMYLTGLGEFDNSGYGQGENSILTYVFFFLATWLVQIVFMNLLIAIMSNTFTVVQGE